MPLYEYRCTQCGYHFEKIQHFNAKRETECPKCHGKLERPLSAPAFQFKGGGWYVNDYASKSSGGSSETSSTAAAPAAESKPATEPGSAPASESSPSKPSSDSSPASSS